MRCYKMCDSRQSKFAMSLTESFLDVFSSKLEICIYMKVSLILKSDDTTVKQKARRVPYEVCAKVEEELDRLLNFF